MTAVTGAGPWPGTEPLQAQTTVVEDLTDTPAGVDGLPFAVVLVDRGPWGDQLGRSVGMLVDLPAELGVHGWRFADRAGADLTRAGAFAGQDLDALAVAAHGYAGPIVVPVLGPLSLAARVDLARGDRVLSDPAALRDVADSLAAGLRERLVALVRAVPGAQPRVLLHEPLLAEAVAGMLPTFSGRGQLRAVPGPVAAERIGAVVAAAQAAGAAGATVHIGSGWGVLGAAEAGTALWAQLPPAAPARGAAPDAASRAEVLVGPWRRVGLPVARLADAVLVAGRPDRAWTLDAARAALGDVVRAARVVVDRALA